MRDFQTDITFGTNTRHNVPVVQNMMNIAINMNDAFNSSWSTKLTATPNTHMTATLYIAIPTYFESFSAGICTALVSQARNAPKSYKIEIG